MATMSIFVSHSHQDNAFCQALVNALRVAGADVWYDEHDMGSGQLGPTIERELRVRPVFVVILSPSALTSQWVEDETRWAYRLYKREPTRILLPVIARPLADMNALWLFLEDFKRVEAGEGQAYERDDAIRHALRALALTPVGERPAPIAPQPTESVDELIERGKALQAQEKHLEALALFQRATVLAPNSFIAWFQTGYTLDDLKRYEESIVAYDRALALKSNYAFVWNNKGSALHGLKRDDEALAAYEHALEIDLSYVHAWNGKGNALRGLKRDDEALVAFEHALEIDLSYVHAWNGKGNALHGLKRYDEALAAYEHALEIDLSYVHAWNGKGNALRGLKRYDEALAAFEHTLMLDPQHIHPYINKATMFTSLQQYQAAKACYNHANHLDSSYQDSFDQDDWQAYITVMRALGRTAEAELAKTKAKELGYAP